MTSIDPYGSHSALYCVLNCNGCPGFWFSQAAAMTHARSRATARRWRQRVAFDNLTEPGGVRGWTVTDVGGVSAAAKFLGQS